jgi:hypothetical protein
MKTQIFPLIFLSFGLFAGTASLVQQRASDEKQPAASPADFGEKTTTDVRDSLPDGALVRLGAVRQRIPAKAQLAIRPDGRTFVSVVAGRIIGEWDVASGTLRRHRQLLGTATENSWLAPNGQLLAVMEKGKLIVWDAANGERRRMLPVNPMRVVFSADGKLLATTE